MQIVALGPDWLDPQNLAESFGLIGVLVDRLRRVRPADRLLPARRLAAVRGRACSWPAVSSAQPLWLVIAADRVMAASPGNITGYFIGRKAGPAVFKRPESRLFKPEYVEQTEEFFDKYGGSALILARFVPIVRTFIPVMAGTSRMQFGTLRRSTRSSAASSGASA